MGDIADEQLVDARLGAVLDEVITSVQETKQAVWAASDAEQRRALDDLRAFLVEHAVALADAEASIGGRATSILSPTGHPPRNLIAEAGGDTVELLRLLRADLEALSEDARRRAAEISGTREARLLGSLGEGLEERVGRISPQHGDA